MLSGNTDSVWFQSYNMKMENMQIFTHKKCLLVLMYSSMLTWLNKFKKKKIK